MFYKIQPKQIQLHDFSSPSGDLRFETGSDYVYVNLSRNLTGNFNVSGQISVNNVRIPVMDASNSVTGSNSFVFGGISNSISGVRNVAVNSRDCSILGTGNLALNSYLSNFPSSSSNNTLIGGQAVTFANNTTGAVVLKDYTASSLTSNGSNSLTASFTGGCFIENGSLSIKNGDLNVSQLNSGLFSGNAHVLGELYENGDRLVNKTEFDVYTGNYSYLIDSINNQLNGLNSNINTTGAYSVSTSGLLNTKIQQTGLYSVVTSGILDAKIQQTGLNSLNNLTVASGILEYKINISSGYFAATTVSAFLEQTINGAKTFASSPISSGSIYLMGDGGILTGASAASNFVPTGSSSSIGSRGLISYSGDFLYLKISDDPHIWIRHSGVSTW